ncbi:MAG: hypothetical protein JWQ97_39 [Phenylobacterium sp.]|nr:hypothetical protein [Phenylobacterium sp.]
MLWILIFAAQFLLMIGAAAFAYAVGGAGERQGALWWGANYIVTTILVATGWNSPTLQLVVDGICATGFLPLAFIYVSWWAGAIALLAAGAFTLEAAYLLQDQTVDAFYMKVNNAITVATGLVFLTSGVVNLWVRRRRAPPAASIDLAAAA